MSKIYPFKIYSQSSGLRNAHKNNNMLIIQVSALFGGVLWESPYVHKKMVLCLFAYGLFAYEKINTFLSYAVFYADSKKTKHHLYESLDVFKI